MLPFIVQKYYHILCTNLDYQVANDQTTTFVLLCIGNEHGSIKFHVPCRDVACPKVGTWGKKGKRKGGNLGKTEEKERE